MNGHAPLCGCDACCDAPRARLRKSLEQAAAEVESWPASVRAAVPNVWDATKEPTRLMPGLEHRYGKRRPEPEPEPEPVHPAPWWYRLAARVLPERVREIPDAREPGRVLLRQLAIIKRRVYLQGFASHEDRQHLHSHGAPLLVIGLWGRTTEWRPGRSWPRLDSWIVQYRTAPYVYFMGAHELHRVDAPTPGHTSIAVYAGEPERVHHPVDGGPAVGWREHVLKRVRRL